MRPGIMTMDNKIDTKTLKNIAGELQRHGGGPAYPVDMEGVHVLGLTKRDFFAIHALQAVISAYYLVASPQQLVHDSIELADMLLQALSNDSSDVKGGGE